MIGATPCMNDQLTDTFFLTTLNMIANKHGFTMMNVDLANRIIDLDGPEEKKEECINEIVSVLEEYLV